MKKSLSLSFLLICGLSSVIFAQGVSPSPTPTRPRVIVVGATPNATPIPKPTVTPNPTQNQKVVVVTSDAPKPVSTPTPNPIVTTTPRPVASPTPALATPFPTTSVVFPKSRLMNVGQVKDKIEEAKRLMQGRPMPIAYTESNLVTDVLRVAFYDWDADQIDFVVMTKAIFLAKNMVYPTLSANGKNVIVSIIRANGVNTPVTIIDSKNQPHTPLVVQYPIERGGQLAEMAYYTSTHPGIVNPDVVVSGKLYVANMIDAAREKLRQKGIYIAPDVANIAERLATVEHVDHARFRNEYHLNIYNDIFTLFALNEGQTYRYSVSSAGAGGMVQMIPSTYRMVMNRYPQVGLMPDFVEGMRNHLNASQAMLLYMQWTWNDLSANQTVAGALDSGIATQADLMAAGYNSNPARLQLYIRRGGANWRSLIPNETKIYLQIYASLERFVPMSPRTK